MTCLLTTCWLRLQPFSLLQRGYLQISLWSLPPQGQNEDPPQMPRKSRKKIRTKSDSDPDFEFELTESDLINLDPVAQHRRNPSRNRRSPDYLHKMDTVYDHPKNKNQRKAIQLPTTTVNDSDPDVNVDMTEQIRQKQYQSPDDHASTC